MFWSKQNAHNYKKVENHPLNVMVWGAINCDHLLGPYFFHGPVNHLNYLVMLENWFILQLKCFGIKSNILFQQDGVQAHFAITVEEYLNAVFPSRWITMDLPPCQLHLTGRFEVLR